jgi:hypothetical protein
MIPMHHSFLQRLAFVKYLYSTGMKQCQAPEPLSSAGLLTLHDAIELFLDLACQHLNITDKKSKELDQYWGPINAKLSNDQTLSQQNAVQRLNKARVQLKHHGAHPSKLDLESYRNTAREFFADNCPMIFGVQLESISMAEFVHPLGARSKVESAMKNHAEGKFNEASHDLIVAFDTMRSDYVQRKVDQFGRSPYQFGPSLTFMTNQLKDLGKVAGRDAERAIADTIRSVMELKRSMQMMALGIDFRRYLRFMTLMPTIHWFAGGNYQIDDMGNSRRNAETIQFCIDFMIESALCLSEFDYDA